MREILFRGKRKNGEWVEGFYSQFHNRPTIDEPNSHQIFELIEEGVRFLKSSIGGYWHIVDPETIGQYTGLTDKNGKKIFEGDILISPIGRKATVEFGTYKPFSTKNSDDFESWMLNVKGYGTCGLGKHCAEYMEVIGNIHDNPELLKGGVQE